MSHTLNPVLLSSAPLAMDVIIIPATIARDHTPASRVLSPNTPMTRRLVYIMAPTIPIPKMNM